MVYMKDYHRNETNHNPYLLDYASNVHSQSGEDGIIGEIISLLNLDNYEANQFVEFGAWDGKHLSNTYNLIENQTNWSGLLIEADKSRYKQLKETCADYPNRLDCLNEHVGYEGKNKLDTILNDTNITRNFDLLSIDVDGPDYFIWKNMVDYVPKIVCIEINAELGCYIQFISEMVPNNRYSIQNTSNKYGLNFNEKRVGEYIRVFGTSFRSMADLGTDKGYTPVSCTKNNLIFVRNDYIHKLKLPSTELQNPKLLFDTTWAKGILPFYKRSIPDNIDLITTSLNDNGVIDTSKLAFKHLMRSLGLIFK